MKGISSASAGIRSRLQRLLLAGAWLATGIGAGWADPVLPPAPDEPQSRDARPEASPPAAAPAPRPRLSVADICRLIHDAAQTHGLPTDFFVRLIWQESRFDPFAVSWKGAQGIAQFMPATAAFRGLADPFDPAQAIPESAAYLRDLHRQFGNWGLAAAAYNAGPGRVADWLAGKAELPGETRAYVQIITGFPAAAWAGQDPEIGTQERVEPAAFRERCEGLVGRGRRGPGQAPEGTPVRAAPRAPWGVQIAGHFSQAEALQSFEAARRRFPALLGPVQPIVISKRLLSRGARPVHLVRVGADSRDGAEKLCANLRAAGGSCIVLKN